MGFCKAAMANLFASLTAIIGFIIGVQISANESARNWIFALTAGNFLYIALVDMVSIEIDFRNFMKMTKYWVNIIGTALNHKKT